MLLLAQAREKRTNERSPFEIEGRERLAPSANPEGCLAPRLRQRGNIERREPEETRGRGNPLRGLRADQREGRAQGLVTAQDLGDRGAERCRLERAGEPCDDRDVVSGRAGFQSVE